MLRGEAVKLKRSFARNSVAARLSGTDMPDDYHPPMPRRNPEDIDLGAIKTDLELLIERSGASPCSSTRPSRRMRAGILASGSIHGAAR
jgi:hypothetical protein